MSILKIARMGHPVLAGRAAPVGRPEGARREEILRVVGDMIETLADIGGVGLAGPQVHAALRIIIFSVPEERSDDPSGGEVAMTALLDPEFTPLSAERVVGWEGCLSIPGLRGAVPRFDHIRYRGLSPEGAPVEREARGFHARVVQHEIDHLDGILYPQRMEDLSRLMFEQEWQRYALREPTPTVPTPIAEDQDR